MITWLRRIYSEKKLPLAVGALWMAAIFALSWLAYVEVVSVQRSAAHERLATVANQLSGMLGADALETTEDVRAIGRRPELASYLRALEPGDEAGFQLAEHDRQAALAALVDTARGAERVVATELRGLSGEQLLTIGPAPDGIA
jgi:hypothetical protein